MAEDIQLTVATHHVQPQEWKTSNVNKDNVHGDDDDHDDDYDDGDGDDYDDGDGDDYDDE